MPMVTERQKRDNRIKKRSAAMTIYLKGLIKATGHTQYECAELFDKTAAGFSYNLKKLNMPLSEFLVLMDYLQPDPDDLAMVLISGEKKANKS